MDWPGKSKRVGLPANVIETPRNGRRRIGDGRNAAEQQGRKKIFDRIEPSLVGVQLSAPAASPSTATRPPVIGRELPLDPERTKRYSSSDLQLEAYLEALRQKTATVPSLEASSDLHHQSSPATSRFVKKSTPTDIGKATPVPTTPSKTTLMPTAQPFSKASSVLQRAQVLTGKLTVVKRTTIDELSPPQDRDLEPELKRTVDVKESLGAERLSRDASSSSGSGIGSFMNIKDIDDLPSDVQLEPNLPISKGAISQSPASSSRHSPKHESTEISDDVTELIEEVSVHQRSTSSSEVRTEKSLPKVASLVSSSSDKQVTASVTDYSYSDDFEIEQSEPQLATPSSERISVRSSSSSTEDRQHVQAPAVQPSKPHMVSKQVQTMPDIAAHMQGDPVRLPILSVPLASFADPQRISSYLVTSETLRTLSSYSPSMMALDELMRHQLRTTRSFLDAQRRMYVSVVDSLKPDHRYTTWTDTQRSIATMRNRRKAIT